MKKNILNFLLIFALLYLVINFFWKPDNSANYQNQIILTPAKKEFSQNELVQAELQNYTQNTVTLPNECPEEPLTVLNYSNGQWVQKKQRAPIPCDETRDIILKPGEKHAVQYTSWNHALFSELGRYKLQAEVLVDNTTNQSGTKTQSQTIESTEFEIKPEGVFQMLWTKVFYQPLYNVLIFLISITPGKNLGLAIIFLTIIIRTILLIPSQNALKSQKKMQEIQPKLEKIREKYKENQEMIAKETMAIWKEHKVNPLGSCLPLIIQLPVLIALFYVIQNGLNPDNHYLLYDFLKQFSFEGIQTNFLGILELTKVNIYILPLIVGALQFLQIKLSMAKATKQKEGDKKKDEKKKTGQPNELEMASRMMMYTMPIMLTIFTASAPAGVGLYWAVSTLYGIGQQLVVNRQNGSKAKVKVVS